MYKVLDYFLILLTGFVNVILYESDIVFKINNTY